MVKISFAFVIFYFWEFSFTPSLCQSNKNTDKFFAVPVREAQRDHGEGHPDLRMCISKAVDSCLKMVDNSPCRNSIMPEETGCKSAKFRPITDLSPEEEDFLFVGGNNPFSKEIAYVCRAEHEGEVLPGAAMGNPLSCYVSKDGKEFEYLKGEVLTNPKNASLMWRPKSPNHAIPSAAVQGGMTSYGGKIFVGRCSLWLNGQRFLIPGKIEPHAPHRLSVPFNGQEYACTEFEILQCKDSSTITNNKTDMRNTRRSRQ